jgi:hypothetical protein
MGSEKVIGLRASNACVPRVGLFVLEGCWILKKPPLQIMVSVHFSLYNRVTLQFFDSSHHSICRPDIVALEMLVVSSAKPLAAPLRVPLFWVFMSSGEIRK